MRLQSQALAENRCEDTGAPVLLVLRIIPERNPPMIKRTLIWLLRHYFLLRYGCRGGLRPPLGLNPFQHTPAWKRVRYRFRHYCWKIENYLYTLSGIPAWWSVTTDRCPVCLGHGGGGPIPDGWPESDPSDFACENCYGTGTLSGKAARDLYDDMNTP